MTHVSSAIDATKLSQIDGSWSRLNQPTIFSLTATNAKFNQAADSRPMNKRSPRVVAMGKNPRRSTVGDLISHSVMPTSIKTMQLKKIATGKVQDLCQRLRSTDIESAHTQ